MQEAEQVSGGQGLALERKGIAAPPVHDSRTAECGHPGKFKSAHQHARLRLEMWPSSTTTPLLTSWSES